jgi:hypothetical protein
MLGAYLGAMAIAAIAAAIELVTRYRDDVGRAVSSAPAIIYIILNGVIALGAVWWLATFFPAVITSASGTGPRVNAPLLAITAGFGSLAALRAGVTKVTIRGQEVTAGPGIIIEGLLLVVDRLVDRQMGDYRGSIADELVPLVPFEQKGATLVSECITRLSNPTPEEGQKLNLLLSSLAGRTDIDANQKSRVLVMALLPIMGGALLKKAVNSVK